MKSTTIITGLGMLGLASAQSSVVSLFLGRDFDNTAFVGKILGNDATATTYSITCPTATATADDVDCGLGPGLVVTEGPKTVHYTVNYPGEYTESQGCSLDGTTFAACSQSMGGSQANFPGKESYTLTGSDVSFKPVTVTAGKVTSVSGATTATGTATGTITASATGKGTVTTGRTKSGTTGTAGETGSGAAAGATETGSETSTGGLPKITGNAGIVAGGLAVAVAGAFI